MEGSRPSTGDSVLILFGPERLFKFGDPLFEPRHFQTLDLAQVI